MSESQKPTLENVFLFEDILPDSSGFFEDDPQGLEATLNDAEIILDTNVLLIPYGAGANSLVEIIKVYDKIKGRGRLAVPAQVAREFVKNRPTKLAELYQGISDKISQLKIPEELSYPILESVEAFSTLNKIIGQLAELKINLKRSSKEVRQEIKNWGWNDPVSQAYRPVFTKDIIVSPEFDRENTLKEMLKRYGHKIPPGYKDSTKIDSGIGDFLIWKTILHIGNTKKRSVIFISGDEKADWFHGAEGNGFLPRYELQAEFNRISDGRDFYIIPLSKLLELEKAEESSVEEIKIEEKRIRKASLISVECPDCGEENICELSEKHGSSALPKCESCDNRFHIHRIHGEVTVRRRSSKKIGDKEIEIIECPNCSAENMKELGQDVNSTGWCMCDDCGKKFPIHRRSDGSVYVNSEYGG